MVRVRPGQSKRSRTADPQVCMGDVESDHGITRGGKNPPRSRLDPRSSWSRWIVMRWRMPPSSGRELKWCRVPRPCFPHSEIRQKEVGVLLPNSIRGQPTTLLFRDRGLAGGNSRPMPLLRPVIKVISRRTPVTGVDALTFASIRLVVIIPLPPMRAWVLEAEPPTLGGGYPPDNQ